MPGPACTIESLEAALLSKKRVETIISLQFWTFVEEQRQVTAIREKLMHKAFGLSKREQAQRSFEEEVMGRVEHIEAQASAALGDATSLRDQGATAEALRSDMLTYVQAIQEIDQIRSQTAKQLEGHLKTAFGTTANPTFGRKVLKTASGAESGLPARPAPFGRSLSRALSGAALLNAATASKKASQAKAKSIWATMRLAIKLKPVKSNVRAYGLKYQPAQERKSAELPDQSTTLQEAKRVHEETEKTSEEVRALLARVARGKYRKTSSAVAPAPPTVTATAASEDESDMTEMQKQTRNLKLALRESVADARQTYDETEEMVDDITDWLRTKAQERKEEQQKSSEPRKPPKRIVPA